MSAPPPPPPAYAEQQNNNTQPHQQQQQQQQEKEHDQIADQKCFLRTVAAFKTYQTAASRVCQKRLQDWKNSLPSGHVELLQFALGSNSNADSLNCNPSSVMMNVPSSATTNGSKNRNDDDGANSSNEQQKQTFEEYQSQLNSFKPASNESWKGPKHFDTQTFCIRKNQSFLSEIAQVAEEDLFDDYFPQKNPYARHPTIPRPRNVGAPTALDQDKVFSTLRQIVRDWSKEGAAERSIVYDYFYEQLEKAFPDPKVRNENTVLVPGGGLSRLMVEIASRGFSARGNEFSYHMLMTGHYIMNHIGENESVTIFPYCDVALNHWNREMQFQAITFPDQSATNLFRNSEDWHGTPHGDLSMVAGDFVEVFSKEEEIGQWNAVASCFFLDTAHNIVEYLQVIHQCLVPGGLLINVGPLLFHWADSFEDVSIEITYDELKRLMWAMGFEIIHEKVVRTAYTNNSNAMKQNFYQCPAFVAKKVEPKYKPSGSMEIDPDRYYKAGQEAKKKLNQQNHHHQHHHGNNNNNNRNNHQQNNSSNNNNNNNGGDQQQQKQHQAYRPRKKNRY